MKYSLVVVFLILQGMNLLGATEGGLLRKEGFASYNTFLKEGHKMKKEIEKIMREAGDILRSYLYIDKYVSYKADGSAVTQVDVQIEQYLIVTLSKLFPEASFWAEESGKQERAKYCWVIDPIDGTLNFIRGIPYFCISLALMEDDDIVLGTIYQPITDEFFFASKTEPATCNDLLLQVSSVERLSGALIAISSFGNPDIRNSLMFIASKTITRKLGAIALDLAYIAAGKIDGGIFPRAQWWDLAAGIFLIERAGGVVSQMDGKKMTNSANNALCAGNVLLAQELSLGITN